MTGRAKKYIRFDLNISEIESIMMKPCFYCGEKGLDVVNGLDRITMEECFDISALVPCCIECIQGKGKKSKEQYLRMCMRVVTHQMYK